MTPLPLKTQKQFHNISVTLCGVCKMDNSRIKTPEGTFKITQGVSDLQKGIQQGDLSRISIYGGPDKGVHTGTNSPTLGRHGQPFSPKK